MTNVLSKSNRRLTINEIVIVLLVLSACTSVFAIAGIIALLPLYALFSGQGKKLLPTNTSDYFLLIFALIAILATAFHAHPATVNGFVIRPLYLYLLSVMILELCFVIYFFRAIITPRAFLLGCDLTVVMSILCFFVAQVQKVLRLYPDPINRPGRVASLFQNENYYAAFAVMALLCACFRFYTGQVKWQKIICFTAIFLNFLGIWYAQSRTALVVAVASLLLYLVIDRKKSAYIIGAVILIYLIYAVFDTRVFPRFDAIRDEFSYRAGIWRVALYAFCDHFLLGGGYFSYAFAWTRHMNEGLYFALHAHELYLEILMNFGIFGAVSLFSFSANTARKAFISVKENRALLALLSSLLFSVLLQGLMDTTILWPQTGFFLVFFFISPRVLKEVQD